MLGKPPAGITLAEAFAQASPQRGPGCSVAKMLGQLGAVDRQLVEGWLAAPTSEISHAHLARTFKAVGYTFGGDTLGRHRRGECRCNDRTQ